MTDLPAKPRVRFAPSPTGHLHVGGARTALFNWLFARHLGGTFILRIEDTDRERSKDEYTHAILAGMRWLGLDWDEGPEVDGGHGPYFQTARLPLYQTALQRLVGEGKVYHCFCSPERLEQVRAAQTAKKENPRYDGLCRGLSVEEIARRHAAGEKSVLRLRVPDGEDVSWNDVTKGPLSFTSDQLDDLVVAKSDGMPTYNFAVVIDDTGMKITHVIRGEDHISNTPKQILIYRALGEPTPQFAHIPMILGEDRSRLSKRHGATSVIDYKDLGFDPKALFNFLALLGWSPADTQQEVFSKEELVKLFSLERIASHGAIFNLEKLRWMNAEYFKGKTPEQLLELFKPWVEKVPGYPADYDAAALQKLVWQFRERVQVCTEIGAKIDYFFADPTSFDAKGLEKAEKTADWRGALRLLADRLAAPGPFDEGSLEATIRALAGERGLKAGQLIHPVRLALSGRTEGAGLFETMAIMGRERCCRRLRRMAELPVPAPSPAPGAAASAG